MLARWAQEQQKQHRERGKSTFVTFLDTSTCSKPVLLKWHVSAQTTAPLHQPGCLAEGLRFRTEVHALLKLGLTEWPFTGDVTKPAAEVTLGFSSKHPDHEVLVPSCIFISAAVCSGSYGAVFGTIFSGPGNSVDVPVLPVPHNVLYNNTGCHQWYHQ